MPFRRTFHVLLLSACLPMLASCANFATPKPKPKPPQIDCAERTPGDPLPKMPTRRAYEPWAAYAATLLGVIAVDRTLRAETADCLDRERAAGRIG